VKLLDWVRRLSAQTETVVELRGRDGQPSRTVRLQVAGRAVQLCPPRHGPERQQEPVTGGCLRCWEPGKRKNAREWVLFTTMPVTEAASARERIEWYRLRWVSRVGSNPIFPEIDIFGKHRSSLEGDCYRSHGHSDIFITYLWLLIGKYSMSA
jgi:hypothetical protein